MNNCRWDNPSTLRDQVDRSNPQTTSSGKVKCTGKRFSWYGSNGFRAKIEPPSCWQYTTGDFLAIRPLTWDQIIDNDDDGENRADPRAPRGGRSRPSDDNDNDDGEGEEHTQGGEKWAAKGKRTTDGKVKGKRKGVGNGKGKGIVKPYEVDSDREG
jgi:hypothetical protein